MNSHLALLVLLFTLRTSQSVRLVIEVENTYFNEQPVTLKDGSDRTIREEEEVQYGKNIYWEFTMESYLKGLRYLCHVSMTSKSGRKGTYLGFFEAFNAAWLEHRFNSLRPDKKITVLWFVFEEGAITKLDPQVSDHDVVSHRWLKIKFAVINDFQEEVELSALDNEDSTVTKEIVPKGKTLRWIHYVTSKTRPFAYKLHASKVTSSRNTQAMGTSRIFKSASIDRAVLEELGTVERWWAVNESGIRRYYPSTEDCEMQGDEAQTARNDRIKTRKWCDY